MWTLGTGGSSPIVRGSFMRAAEDQTNTNGPSVIRVDAVERYVELLSRVDEDPTSDDFYSRLCEATCQLAGMDRAVIFRFDEVLRRVRAVGSYGIDLKVFATTNLTMESAPIARRSLEEDRVIDVPETAERTIPTEYKGLLREATLVCTPISAAGRWSGVIISDRTPRQPLNDEERHLLWALGKSVALATYARLATFQYENERRFQERIELTREIHESVIQRLFGVQLAFASDGELSREARDRCASEIQAALAELRRALQRPLVHVAPTTHTTLIEEVERLSSTYPDLGIELMPGSEDAPPPERFEALAQSVLAEAVRNARKHSNTARVEVKTKRINDAWMMEVLNDQVKPGANRRRVGVGLRLAALETLQVGGILESRKSRAGTWRLRLTLPDER
jgi:signal transduction histidine kinase